MSKSISKIIISLFLIFFTSFVFAEPTISVNQLATNLTTPLVTGAFDLNGVSEDANFEVIINSVSYTSLDSNIDVNLIDNTWKLTTLDLAEGPYDVNAMMIIGENTYYDNTVDELTIDTVAPVITPLNNIATNQITSVSATATDNAGSGVASYQWSADSGNVVISAADSSTTDISATADGNYPITLTVTDNAGNSSTASFYFVWDVTPPVISRNDVYTNQTINVDANAIDVGSGIFSYFWQKYDENVNILSPTSEFTDINATIDGNYTITLTVTDNAGNSQNKDFNFIWDTVAPEITSTFEDVDTNHTRTVTVTATDIAGSGVANYQWTADSDNVVFSATDSNVTDINATDVGNYTITLTVTDRAGNSRPTSFNFFWDANAPVLTNITIPNRFEMILGFDENVYFETNDENTIEKIKVNEVDNTISSIDINNNIVTIKFLTEFALFTDINASFEIEANAFVDRLENKTPLIDNTYLTANTTIEDNALPFSYIDSTNNDENNLRIFFTEPINLDVAPPTLDINNLVDGNNLTDCFEINDDVNSNNFVATYHNDVNGIYIDFITTDSNNNAKIEFKKIFYSFVDYSNNPYTSFPLVLENNKWSFQKLLSPDDNHIIFDPNESSHSIIIPNGVDSNSQVVLDFSSIFDQDNNSMTVPEDNNFFFERQTNTNNHSVTIPSGTIISGPNGWDGNLILPTLTDNYDMGATGTTNITITIGSNNTLVFSKAVKIVIGGMRGKRAAYKKGTTHELIPLCDSNQVKDPDTYLKEETGNNCYTNEEADLVIWTKHFTDFIIYTPASSGGTGTGSTGTTGTTGTEEENKVRARCSDIDISTTSLTINSNSTSTKSIVIKNNSKSFDFKIDKVRIREPSGLEVTIKDKPRRIDYRDSENLKLELKSDKFKSLVTRTIELEIEGTFDDYYKTECTREENIKVRIQPVTEEEPEQPEETNTIVDDTDNLDTDIVTENTTTDAPEATTGDAVITAASEENQTPEPPAKKKSNAWLFWLLDLAILVLIIGIILFVKKKKDPRRKRL